MTITEFVEARLAEIEAAARESYYEGQRWLTEEEGVYTWPGDELVHSADRKADARHIALHGPARVLRGAEAGRRLLELADEADAMERSLNDEVARHPVPGEITVGDLIRRTLAAIDSDHPDYDPSWTPAQENA